MTVLVKQKQRPNELLYNIFVSINESFQNIFLKPFIFLKYNQDQANFRLT